MSFIHFYLYFCILNLEEREDFIEKQDITKISLDWSSGTNIGNEFSIQ